MSAISVALCLLGILAISRVQAQTVTPAAELAGNNLVADYYGSSIDCDFDAFNSNDQLLELAAACDTELFSVEGLESCPTACADVFKQDNGCTANYNKVEAAALEKWAAALENGEALDANDIAYLQAQEDLISSITGTESVDVASYLVDYPLSLADEFRSEAEEKIKTNSLCSAAAASTPDTSAHSGASDVVGDAKDTAEEAADTVGDKVADVGDAISDVAGDVKDRIGNAFSALTGAASCKTIIGAIVMPIVGAWMM